MPELPPDLPPLFDDLPPKKNGAALRVVDEFEDPPAPPLILNKRGRPFKTIPNVVDMLRDHAEWAGVIVWDDFAQCIRKTRAPPVRPCDLSDAVVAGPWTEGDTIRAQAWLRARPSFHQIDAGSQLVESAVLAVAEHTRVHPVRDWLSALKWDATQRLRDLFVDHFGAVDTELNREIGKRWMISAVARVFDPGCRCKYMPVLEAAQDSGKSTGIEALINGSGKDRWYTDTALKIGHVDAYQCLRSHWVVEWSELAAVKSARDVESLKSFISSSSDNFRASYAKHNADHARQCVFIGTTNEERWLTDPTGGSRFWPVRCTPGVLVQHNAILDDREQLWAEAVARYESGEIWWIDPNSEKLLLADARAEQADRLEADAWIEIIAAWLDSPTVPDGNGGRSRLDLEADGFTTADVLLGALQYRPSDIRHGVAIRAGHCLQSLGWMSHRARRSGKILRVYRPDGWRDGDEIDPDVD